MVGDAGAAPAWVGSPPSRVQRVATMFVGVTGLMFAGVGPLLLGGLEADHRLSAAQIGLAGTAELLTMGLAAGLTGPLFGAVRLRLLAVTCGLLMAALNYATMEVSGGWLILMRALNGLPSGGLVWLMTGLIVRAPRPERWAGLYLTLQTLAQLGMVAALTAFVLTPLGVDGGFGALALLGGAAALCGFAVPASYAALPGDSLADARWPDRRGWWALAAGFCMLAFILAVWMYLEPLARQAGLTERLAGTAVALSLGAQVSGGAAATVLAGRLPWFSTLALSIVALVGVIAVLAALPGPTTFLICAALFGFLWLFSTPFLAALAIAADPSRRAAALGSGAQLLGCSAGPLLDSLLVRDGEVRGSLALGAALALVCLAIVIGLRFTARRPG
jgi:hypothetical protein